MNTKLLKANTANWPIHSVNTSFDFLLYLLRKDQLQSMFNFLPKFFNRSPNPCGNISRALLLLLLTQLKKAVGSALRNFARVYFDNCLFEMEFLRMQKVVDRYRIVVRWIWPIIRLYIEFLIMHQHVIEGLSERMIAVVFEFVVDLLICQEEMSDL